MNWLINILLVIIFWLSSMIVGYVIAKERFTEIPCSITFSDATGNRHEFVGSGIAY